MGRGAGGGTAGRAAEMPATPAGWRKAGRTFSAERFGRRVTIGNVGTLSARWAQQRFERQDLPGERNALVSQGATSYFDTFREALRSSEGWIDASPLR